MTKQEQEKQQSKNIELLLENYYKMDERAKNDLLIASFSLSIAYPERTPPRLRLV